MHPALRPYVLSEPARYAFERGFTHQMTGFDPVEVPRPGNDNQSLFQAAA